MVITKYTKSSIWTVIKIQTVGCLYLFVCNNHHLVISKRSEVRCCVRVCARVRARARVSMASTDQSPLMGLAKRLCKALQQQ